VPTFYRFGTSPTANISFIGTEPSSRGPKADAAVKALGWKQILSCGWTISAWRRWTGHCAVRFLYDRRGRQHRQTRDAADVKAFVDRHPEIIGTVAIPHIDHPVHDHAHGGGARGEQVFAGEQDAGKIYQHIVKARRENFITEVSMDETDSPQTPPELLIILARSPTRRFLSRHRGRIHGPFNKGVDYVAM